MPLPNVRVGEVLAGKYRIDKVLGIGGMGVVVAAHHLHLDERVAIKFLLPEVAKNRVAVARFTREARAAIKIKSEYVARVSDVGVLDDGTAYMVMEYLEGRDLASWVRSDGPLAVPEGIELVLQACEALAEAHALAIVHRDLKPANLFAVRRADGLTAVRVLDFGISKSAGLTSASAGHGLTKTNQIMGSPHYMSPEQLLAAHEVDARSDIWSLGVVLYEILTGRLPFEGDSVPIVCSRILQGELLPARRLRGDIPAGLEAAIARCLAKDPAQRFASVAQLAAALVDFGPPRARFSAERIARTLASVPVEPAAPKTSPVVAHHGKTIPLPPSATPSNTMRLPDADEAAPDGDTAAGAESTGRAASDRPPVIGRSRPRNGRRAALATAVVLVTAGAWWLTHPSSVRPPASPAAEQSASVMPAPLPGPSPSPSSPAAARAQAPLPRISIEALPSPPADVPKQPAGAAEVAVKRKPADVRAPIAREHVGPRRPHEPQHAAAPVPAIDRRRDQNQSPLELLDLASDRK